jgi:hypothetical protein
MKKKYVIAGSVTGFMFVLFLAVWIIQPDISVFNALSISRQRVDVSKDIIFEFNGAIVSVNEWGKDYVEITYDNVFGKKTEMNIMNTDNTITLKSKLDFNGAKHITMNVPKSVIRMTAKSIRSKGGTFRAVHADEASLRYCTLADGFTSEGRSLEVREAKFEGKCRIGNEIINIRECDMVDMDLSSVESGKEIKAYLRELSGLSVHLDANSCSNLSVELKDTNLDTLIVDYPGSKGEVTVFGGDIKNICNNSALKIRRKSSILN